MKIKKHSTTHHIMLILASNKNRAKTMDTLLSVCQKDPYRIRRAINQLNRYGFIETHLDEDSDRLYRLSLDGRNHLFEMVSV